MKFKHVLLAAGMVALLSGPAVAAPTITVSSCNTDSVTKTSSGLSGSGSCGVVLTHAGDSFSGSVSLSFSGYGVSLSGSVSGSSSSSFSAASTSQSGTEEGYLWSCTVNSGSGSAGTSVTIPLTGSCSLVLGGVAGVASASGVQQQVQATVAQQVSAVSNIIGSRMLSSVSGGPLGSSKQASSGSGLAAGGTAEKFNAWTTLAKNDSSYSPTDTGKKRSSAISNAVVGADYQLSPSMILGISAAFDRGDGSVTATATGTSTEGYAFAPYLGVQLGSNMALDLSVGIGKGEARQAGGLKAESDRQFYAANLGYAQWLGNLQLSGKAGYLISHEKYGNSTTNGVTNANTASKNEVEQLNLNAEVGYWMSGGVMPYLGLGYTQDTRMKTAVADSDWDKDSFILKAGVNFFSIANKVTGGIAYTEENGRRSAKNSTLMGNINFRF